MFSWIFKLFNFFLGFAQFSYALLFLLFPTLQYIVTRIDFQQVSYGALFLCPNTYFRTLVEVCSPTIFLIFLAPEPKPIITRINFQRVSYIGAFFCVPQNRVSGHLLKYVLQLYLLAPEPKPLRKNLRTGIWFLFLVHVSIALSFKCYWPQNASNNYRQK